MRRRWGMALAVAVGLAASVQAQLASETVLPRQTYAVLTQNGDVRGRNGTRRLFPDWTSAQVYQIWGIKIRQIR